MKPAQAERTDRSLVVDRRLSGSSLRDAVLQVANRKSVDVSQIDLDFEDLAFGAIQDVAFSDDGRDFLALATDEDRVVLVRGGSIVLEELGIRFNSVRYTADLSKILAIVDRKGGDERLHFIGDKPETLRSYEANMIDVLAVSTDLGNVVVAFTWLVGRLVKGEGQTGIYKFGFENDRLSTPGVVSVRGSFNIAKALFNEEFSRVLWKARKMRRDGSADDAREYLFDGNQIIAKGDAVDFAADENLERVMVMVQRGNHFQIIPIGQVMFEGKGKLGRWRYSEDLTLVAVDVVFKEKGQQKHQLWYMTPGERGVTRVFDELNDLQRSGNVIEARVTRNGVARKIVIGKCEEAAEEEEPAESPEELPPGGKSATSETNPCPGCLGQSKVHTHGRGGGGGG